MEINIGFSVSIDNDGNIIIEKLANEQPLRKQRNKGNSLLNFVNEFVVIDIETTGFDPNYDEILEIGALKYKDNLELDTFHSYVALEDKNLYTEDDDYPLNVHGNITVGMLKDASEIKEVLSQLYDFIGNNTLIAHNANFDINFLYDKFKKYLNIHFNNDFIDTLRISRRLFPELQNHKLTTISKHFNICSPDHRSISDCYTTLEFYNICKDKCLKENIELRDCKISNVSSERITNLHKESIAIKNKIRDCKNTFVDNCLVNKTVVFTGTLENLIRKDAIQLVINLGGNVSDSINKNTNYLVMGIQDYSKFADGKESSKTKKAKQLIQAGQNLQIIDENEFIRMTSLKLQEG